MSAQESIRNVNAIRHAAIETLEDRQLMSAYMAGTSTLKVICGSGNDVVKITRDATNFYVSENGVKSTFPAAPVSWIHCMGFGGNDYISVAADITIPAELDGNDGNDILIGGAGKDVLGGDAGDDTMDGGLGADTFYGLTGKDVVTYASRTTPVKINRSTFHEAGDDGAVGEGDSIRDSVEEVRGGAGNDTFIGSDAIADRFFGNGGNDSFDTRGGNDYVNAGDGNDVIDAGPGNDSIFAGAGDDMIFGKAGNDFIMGEAGKDFIDGDVGADRMSGGADEDTVAYFTRTKNLSITLDDVNDDGEANESDNVMSDVEVVSAGSGNDRIVGNDLNNRFYGNGGHDSINGGKGDDLIDGGEGNDSLAAGGGSGKDTLLGGNGDDVLTTIGGGADAASGQGGNDIFWVDSLDSTDATASEKSAGRVITVSSYANGAAFEPDGQDISDPSLTGLSDRNAKYGATFSNIRLFAGAGPSIEDVDQNNLGSCWFMAAIAGIAKAKPETIRTSVAELGDGTYVVRLYSGSTAKFYRVDSQLPVDVATGTMPQFAFPKNGAMWAPILEKAMALHRTTARTYKGAEGGRSTEAFSMFNKSGDYWDTYWHSEDSMAQKMRSVLAAGGVVTAGSDPSLLISSVESSHAYTVISVSPDLKTITLRNPWARDGKGSNDGNDDGYVTMSMTKFDDDFYTIYWSNL